MDDQAFPDVSKSFTKPQKSPRTIIIIVSFLIILGILIFGGAKLLGSRVKNDAKLTPTEAPVPTAEIKPSDTPVPTEKVTPTPTKSVSAKVTPSPIKPSATVTPKVTQTTQIQDTTGLKRSDITVNILNGSGEKGAASKMASTLKDLGYVIGSTGNADNFDYQNVTIQVKSIKKGYISLLKNDLSTSYTIGSATADLPGTSTADALVIIGK